MKKDKLYLWTQEGTGRRWLGYLVKTLAVLLVLFVIVKVFVKLNPKPVEDPAKGIAQIEALEKTDVAEAERSIQEIRELRENSAGNTDSSDQNSPGKDDSTDPDDSGNGEDPEDPEDSGSGGETE